jgi:hypothetical protein
MSKIEEGIESMLADIQAVEDELDKLPPPPLRVRLHPELSWRPTNRRAYIVEEDLLLDDASANPAFSAPRPKTEGPTLMLADHYVEPMLKLMVLNRIEPIL